MDDANEWCGIRIGLDPARRVELTYLGPLSGPEDRWQRFLVDARSPGFTARFECDTVLGIFATFRDDVRAMYATLGGTATLRFREDGIQIHGVTNRSGHVLWRIELQYPMEFDSSRLTFEIREDQTMLRNLIAQIERLLDVAKFRPGTRRSGLGDFGA